MFGITACVFRFANVVGGRQTHGVGFDFVRRLLVNPDRLAIMGDGTQSKCCIHVSDSVAAVLHAARYSPKDFDAYNVATGDYIPVTEIAELAAECLELPVLPRFDYAGGGRGWKGDVPWCGSTPTAFRGLAGAVGTVAVRRYGSRSWR